MVDPEVAKKTTEEAKADPQQHELPRDHPSPEMTTEEIDFGVIHEKSDPEAFSDEDLVRDMAWDEEDLYNLCKLSWTPAS